MDAIRHKKLEEQLREEIASLILSGEVKDPRVGPFVSVTRVEAARDLSAAKVFVSIFALVSDEVPAAPAGASAGQGKSPVDEESARLDRAAEGLNRAAGYIQAQVGKRLRTRLTPKLVFVADHGIKEGFELNERIKGLFT
ncbi:MAG: ribosome-binding factor A [Spirochaetaceae bacterium]|nr:ribosome-binding factor A [Spirochaetaceae bacterium]